MNAKRTAKSTEPEPTSEPDQNPRLADLEAQIADRTASAVSAAQRADSDIRRANAHLPAEDLT